MRNQLKKILVIGAGLSGMATAIELSKRGIQVEVIEKDASWRTDDEALFLGPSALRAFGNLGLLDGVLNHGEFWDQIDAYHPNGNRLAFIMTSRLARADVMGSGAIGRRVVAALLTSAALQLGVRFRLGCSFTELSQDARGVDVDFSDGSCQRYDLVVGADGEFSEVRKYLFPTSFLRNYPGISVWQAILPRDPQIDRGMMWLGPSTTVGIAPISAFQTCLSVTSSSIFGQRIPLVQAHSLLCGILEQFDATVIRQSLIELRKDVSTSYRRYTGGLMLRPWSSGRVVLVGKAVHSVASNIALGACLGVEDGIVLAEHLDRCNRVYDGLSAFEAKRWARCRLVVENTIRLGQEDLSIGAKAKRVNIMRQTLSTLNFPI